MGDKIKEKHSRPAKQYPGDSMFRADVFRVALAELNTNQKALAKRLKISESTFTKIKHGMEPRVSLAMRIAKALNKTVYDLWEEPGE